ncbi:HD family phosphohydrolase [Caldilinea sp.]|jgi:putative nucleotidyltransferase with HDIG domain|uniref:HD family phosphohydrolase n=1 Tax=Caldilinea sp. TaxID=2293560 RepID=UPI0026364E48|nr:HDIG domain-containing metalloprotein [uncultured Caldilinea sp.]
MDIQRFWGAVRRTLRSDRLHQWILSLLMLASLAITMVALLAWQLPYGSRLLLQPGEIAPFTVVAPQPITFESEVLTERARERAAQQVPDQYDFEEASIRRQRIEAARQALAQATAIRRQEEKTLAQKTNELLAIEELGLDAETAVQILSLSDEQWAQVEHEVIAVLDRVMRLEIRESTINQARNSVPALVSRSLDEDASDVAIQLVKNLIRPNSFYNAERTAALRAEARAGVPPQTITLVRGETVIRSGDRATPEQVEKLAALSKLQSEWDFWTVTRNAVFVLLWLTVTLSALAKVRRPLLQNLREQALLLVITVIWLLAAKAMIVNHPLLPFIYPLAAYAILVSVFCKMRVAQVLITMFALLLLYMLPTNATMVIYQTTGAMLAVLLVGRAERLNSFIWAGVVVGLSNLAVLIAISAPFSTYSSTMLVELLLATVVNGALTAAIALIGYFVLGNLFDIVTPLQLNELSRPTHPLLRQVLLKASGTYHHTILVSNLAERAAAAIGADALLVRVGAYYHDIGKTVRPYFFAENIMDGSSPHDKLDPLTSAQIIISHVKDGVDLAQKYKLPERIQDFIREHHGRSLVKYFYLMAQQQSQDGATVNEEDFRYPGPNPRSRETAIVMLADTCEAAVRAMRPSSREELELLVNRLIDERVASGELNDSDLTFRDLQTIKEVFLQVLQGVHHPRIKYPESASVQPQEQPARAPEGNGAGRKTTQRAGWEVEGLEERAPSSDVQRTPAMEG